MALSPLFISQKDRSVSKQTSVWFWKTWKIDTGSWKYRRSCPGLFGLMKHGADVDADDFIGVLTDIAVAPWWPVPVWVFHQTDTLNTLFNSNADSD